MTRNCACHIHSIKVINLFYTGVAWHLLNQVIFWKSTHFFKKMLFCFILKCIMILSSNRHHVQKSCNLFRSLLFETYFKQFSDKYHSVITSFLFLYIVYKPTIMGYYLCQNSCLNTTASFALSINDLREVQLLQQINQILI